jgi:hypothetical protein
MMSSLIRQERDKEMCVTHRKSYKPKKTCGAKLLKRHNFELKATYDVFVFFDADLRQKKGSV